MDDPGKQSRRHYDSHGQNVSNPGYASQPNRPTQGSATDRFRQTPVSSAPQIPRTIGSTSSYSSYYQDPSPTFPSSNMPSSALTAYGADYGQDARQQSQGFGNYSAAGLVYNVAQANTQTPGSYDAQHFGSRQPAPIHMMPPDITPAYFSDASASTSGLPQPTTASSFQQNPALTYTSSMAGAGTVQQASGSTEGPVSEDAEYSEGSLEEKWMSYQRQLASVFKDIQSGSLEPASETLLSISRWLLAQVSELGLTVDDASLHSERIKLWNDFNHAWLALGQKQVELMHSRHQQAGAQRWLSREVLEKLGNELVQLCDGLERHGLVDYQYGVWEEQIVEVLGDCLDFYDTQEHGD